MKDFFKYMLATICGIVAMGIFAGIIFMISFASMIASGSATPEVKDNSVLVIKMSGTVNEQAEEGTPFDALLGAADMENLGLDNIVKAIELAKAITDAFEASSLERLQEEVAAWRQEMREY